VNAAMNQDTAPTARQSEILAFIRAAVRETGAAADAPREIARAFGFPLAPTPPSNAPAGAAPARG